MNKYILFITSLCLTASCQKANIEPAEDFAPHLSNMGSNVIVKTYEDLKIQAANLHEQALLFRTDASETQLATARLAWVAARSPWEQSEGFLFGPVDQEGLDPSLDSWPVNITDLENVLSGTDAITAAFLSVQEGNLKGFHTIEFLLWGVDGNKLAADFTARELDYLEAATAVLSSDADALFGLWAADEGNFVSNLIHAGQDGSIYISQKAALEELSNALVVIADEVANGKIHDPFSQEDLSLEESRFSNNSIADFSDNMRSIRNVYTGNYNFFGDGQSISSILAATDAATDAALLEAMDAAISSIENIPGTFGEAVFANPEYVQLAQDAVRNLQTLLESELIPFIHAL